MIVQAKNAQKIGFLEGDFVLLSHGAESMIAKMLYKKDDNVPFHKHPNKQTGYVLSGTYMLVRQERTIYNEETVNSNSKCTKK